VPELPNLVCTLRELHAPVPDDVSRFTNASWHSV
jgi:hypothetical protein